MSHHRLEEQVRPHSSFAVVARIEAIVPHPNPEVERLEVLKLASGVSLVTGKHYHVGDLGIYLRPGCLIPGWIAEDLWLVGRKRAHGWFEVRELSIKGAVSPGLWIGSLYMNDGSDESAERMRDLKAKGATPLGWTELARGGEWIRWPHWRDHWTEGFNLDGYLGIVPTPDSDYVVKFRKKKRSRSSAEEQPVANRKVAAKTTTDEPLPDGGAAAVEALGSNPAASSTYFPDPSAIAKTAINTVDRMLGQPPTYPVQIEPE